MPYKYDVGRYIISGDEIERVRALAGFAWIAITLTEPDNVNYIRINEMYAANSSGGKLPTGEMRFLNDGDKDLKLKQAFINASFRISAAMLNKVSKNLHKEINYMELKPNEYNISGPGNGNDYVGFKVKTKHK